jgi:hypothetical protein
MLNSLDEREIRSLLSYSDIDWYVFKSVVLNSIIFIKTCS